MRKKVLLIVIIGAFLHIQPLGAQTWEASKRLTWNSGWSYQPAITVNSNNHIHLVWHDGTPGNNEIYYSRSTNDGKTWAAKRLTWSSGNSQGPNIAVDSNDHINVVWRDKTVNVKDLSHLFGKDFSYRFGKQFSHFSASRK